MKSTANYSKQIEQLKQELEKADAVVIGAGAGLSAAAGISYGGERFSSNFADFIKKYGLRDMYSAGFYPYASLEEYWAYWSRHIFLNRYAEDCGAVYPDLLRLVQDKNYFVITTNVDHCFQKAGFDTKRLFYTQGDYGLWQCSVPCHQETYSNEETVKRMVAKQNDMRIPTELIPYCCKCGAPLTNNLRTDSTFVEDEGWHKAKARYEDFLYRHGALQVLFLELGVGSNTPVIIKYPFWQMVYRNEQAVYACINRGEANAPIEIKERSLCIDADINAVLHDLNT